MKPLFSLGIATGLMLFATALIERQPLFVSAGCFLLALLTLWAMLLWWRR